MFGWLLIPVCDRIDTLLARHGSFDAVQKFRLHAFQFYVRNDDIDPSVVEELCMEIMHIETVLRQLAQREESLTEWHQSLALTASLKEKKQLSTLVQELETIRKEYWFLERELYKNEALLPRGAFLRAYNLWRSDTNWYLHPDLVNDCAGNGGCCGRDCGCCEKRRKAAAADTRRARAVGHCTMECGCCARSRGFDIRSQKDVLKTVTIIGSALNDQSNDTYHRRLLRAYFFGIGSGVDAAPSWT